MQVCFGVPRFWAFLRHSSNPSESTRPKPHIGSAEGKMQPQRCWPTPRQRGPKTSTRLFDITDWSSWLGRLEFGKALQTSTPCRPHCAAPWPGSVPHLKRPWCGATDAEATFRAHAFAAGLERAVCEAPHDPRRHQDRPPGRGAQNGGLLGWTRLPFYVV